MPNQMNSARRRSHGRRGRVHRQPNTGFFGKLFIMLAVVAAVVLGIAIFFRVRTVEVQGNSIYSAAQVSESSGLEIGDNLLMVNRATVTGKVRAALPFVQNVSVGLILPDTVVIQVKESDIAGRVKSASGGSWFVNVNGRVLGSNLDAFHGQVVNLDGFTVDSPKEGEQAAASEGQEDCLQAALQVMSEMEGTGLIGQVTSIDTEEPFDIELFCGEQYQVLMAGTDDLDYKIQYLQVVLDGLEDYQTGTIDLTFDQERVAFFTQWQ